MPTPLQPRLRPKPSLRLNLKSSLDLLAIALNSFLRVRAMTLTGQFMHLTEDMVAEFKRSKEVLRKLHEKKP